MEIGDYRFLFLCCDSCSNWLSDFYVVRQVV